MVVRALVEWPARPGHGRAARVPHNRFLDVLPHRRAGDSSKNAHGGVLKARNSLSDVSADATCSDFPWSEVVFPRPCDLEATGCHDVEVVGAEVALRDDLTACQNFVRSIGKQRIAESKIMGTRNSTP